MWGDGSGLQIRIGFPFLFFFRTTLSSPFPFFLFFYLSRHRGGGRGRGGGGEGKVFVDVVGGGKEEVPQNKQLAVFGGGEIGSGRSEEEDWRQYREQGGRSAKVQCET